MYASGCGFNAHDAKIQFSNEKTFDRIYFEFEKPTKFRSQKFSSQILIEFNSPVANKFEKKGRFRKVHKRLLLQDEGREAVVTMQDKLEYKVYRVANKIILDVGPEVESAFKGLEGPKDGKLQQKAN